MWQKVIISHVKAHKLSLLLLGNQLSSVSIFKLQKYKNGWSKSSWARKSGCKKMHMHTGSKKRGETILKSTKTHNERDECYPEVHMPTCTWKWENIMILITLH